MDSWSQAVLGAAVGEAVLGKKIGNRAMVLGAIGGTIPDLDVFVANALEKAGYFTSLEAMDFHRGTSHSFAFAILAPFLIALVVQLFYRSGSQHNILNRIIWSLLVVGAFFLVASYLFFVMILVAAQYDSLISPPGNYIFFGSVGLLTVSLLIVLIVRLYKGYLRPKQSEINVSYWSWYALFVGAFITHILLDYFTNYGTQLLMPFSNERFAFPIVSVVDPVYTAPFIFFTVLAACMVRKSRFRSITNWVGILVSSGYLVFAAYASTQAKEALSNTAQSKGIQVLDMNTNPPFTSFLWQCVAESDSAYHIGSYSIFDPQKKVSNLNSIPKNHHLFAPYADNKDGQILHRFARGFYALDTLPDDKTLFIVTLYGSIGEFTSKEAKLDFPVRQVIYKKNDEIVVERIDNRDMAKYFSAETLRTFYRRIAGHNK